MAKTMPNVIVAFNELGITSITRAKHGAIAIVLPSDPAIDGVTMYSQEDIPEGAKEYSVEQIKLAMKGYVLAPRKITAYSVDTAAESAEIDYTNILKKLTRTKFDWLVVPGISDKGAETIADWIKAQRTQKDRGFKAVLPNQKADTEGVVNFTTKTIKTADKTYKTADYCSRIAGIIAGTPDTISCTYAPLPELVEVETYTDEEMDQKVANGELFLFSDGEKVKIARGVNSLTTTVQGKGEDFQKIKLVSLMDVIKQDITDTAKESYIGKYANSYDNRCLLITAIQGYFDTLEAAGLLEKDQNTVDIDLVAVKNWRESNGLNTKAELAGMKDQEIKQLNIHDNVFLTAHISMLDAIESIALNINVE